MPKPPDHLSISFEELRSRCDKTIAASHELVAQLRVLLAEHQRLHDHFVDSHRDAYTREDAWMGDRR